MDDIYGPLYYQLNKIYQFLSKSSDHFYYPDQNEVTWESIQATYKYYLVDPPLRNEMDDFFELLRLYNQGNSQRTRIADEKLLPHLRNAYGQDVQTAMYQVAALQPNGMPTVLAGSTLGWPILSGEHPLEFTKKQYPGLTNYRLELSLQKHGQVQPLFTVNTPNPELESKFEEVLRVTINEVKKDQRIILVEEQRRMLIAQATSLKEKLRIKTEEPWRV